ncbi:hypothetical protein AALO_G00008230 [Alosa alosa]|uniref:Cyclin-dependent kinase 2-associated protein n=2 Tax=Alosa TaxID=34772 RepID=A0AAV6HF61_9TELE|nr:hypothetical protein AALO_G00008230 [Alosa alosa]
MPRRPGFKTGWGHCSLPSLQEFYSEQQAYVAYLIEEQRHIRLIFCDALQYKYITTDGNGEYHQGELRMSYKPIAPAPAGSNHTPPGSSVPSPSLPSSSNFRPAFSDFGPPSMGFVQPVKVSQGSTYSELLSVIEEMGREIRPTYAGSKSAMERLKRGIIHARALVRECLAETERSART